jgi:hypothetical protein
LTISAIHKATPRSSRRKKLADELLTELTSWTPRERMGARLSCLFGSSAGGPE